MRANSLIFLIVLCLFACVNSKKEAEVNTYQNQIGDTPFDQNLDDISFTFCDSTNVLHKRAWIIYEGGKRALEKDLIHKFNAKPSYESFSGYFIIRFAVNCNDQLGRYRTEILDSNFKTTSCNDDLESHLISTFKSLKKWKHPFYEGKDYDGYTFYTIKITNGKIEKS